MEEGQKIDTMWLELQERVITTVVDSLHETVPDANIVQFMQLSLKLLEDVCASCKTAMEHYGIPHYPDKLSIEEMQDVVCRMAFDREVEEGKRSRDKGHTS